MSLDRIKNAGYNKKEVLQKYWLLTKMQTGRSR